MKTIFTYIGKAPNGQSMYQWVEPDGSTFTEFWQPSPGGGYVSYRQS